LRYSWVSRANEAAESSRLAYISLQAGECMPIEEIAKIG